MAPAFDLLGFVVRCRVDEIALVLATIVGCGICRWYLRRRGAIQELSGKTLVWVFLTTIVSVPLVEWSAALHGQPASASRSVVVMTRISVLGAAAILAAVWLFAAARIALLRAELRVHADAGRQLQQAKASADDANRVKSDFLAIISHEIRTPLNALMGFSNLLSESSLDETQRSYVNTITSEGARLNALINDILDFTKIEKGGLVLESLPFAPAEAAQEVLRLLSPRAAEKKLDLRFEAQLTGPLVVTGDPLRFRQILANLIDNAIKFTPRGSVTLFMAWNPPPENTPAGRLAVRVRDSGIGIAPEKLRDIFQMFMQADTSTARRYGGTGLGLAITERLVILMGGEIVAHSRQGEGSEFSFTLPLPLSASVPETPAVGEPEIKRSHPPRILVVDDMETNRFLLEVFLRRQGFEPELAAGGEEAVRLALENQYDAILMDLQMPDIDGYTAARRIRAGEADGRRHTPIIALTASIAKGTRERCLDAGMDEHLTKPLDLRKFKLLLNTFLNATPEPASLAR